MSEAQKLRGDLDALLRFVLPNIDVDLPPGKDIDTVDLSGVDVRELIRCATNDTPYRIPAPSAAASAAPSATAAAAAAAAAATAVPSSSRPAGGDDLPAIASLDDLLGGGGGNSGAVSDGEDHPHDGPHSHGHKGRASPAAEAGDGDAGPYALRLDREDRAILAFTLLLDTLPEGHDTHALRIARANLGIASKRAQKCAALSGLGAAGGANAAHDVVSRSASLLEGPLSAPLGDALGDTTFADAISEMKRRTELLRACLACLFASRGVGPNDECVIGGEHVPAVGARVEEEMARPAQIAARFAERAEFEKFGGPAFEEACQRTAAYARLCAEAAASLPSPAAAGGGGGDLAAALSLSDSTPPGPARPGALPFPVAASMYELLLTSIFDAHENDGSLTHGSDGILALLSHFGAAHGVTGTAAELALVRVCHELFVAMEEPPLLDRAMEKLQAAVEQGGDRGLGLGRAGNDGWYAARVLGSIRRHCTETLESYREQFLREPASLTAVVDCYAFVRGIEDPACTAAAATAEVVRAAVRAQYKSLRSGANLASGAGPAELADFLAGVVEEVDTDLTHFAPHFPVSDEVPSAGPLFVSAYLSAIESDVRRALGSEVRIDASAARIVSTLTSLEAKLPASHRGQALDPVYDLFRAALMDWVEEKETTFATFVARAIRAEQWKPVADAPSFSSSVLDMFAILSQAVPFVFEFRIPRLLPIVNSMALKVESLVCAYADAVVRAVGPRERFIPPLPGFSMSKTKFGGLVAKKTDPPFISPETQRVLDAQTLESLFVRLNSLLECPAKLRSLHDLMERRFEEIREERPDAGDVPLRELNLFDAAYAALETRATELRDYIGAKAVFYDLRQPFLENLYVPSPKQSRLLPITEMTDPVLGQVMEHVFYDHTREVIQSIFEAYLACFRRVLLDGGPDRVFSIADATLFADDVNLIGDLFMAIDETGEAMGLPQGYVLANVSHLQNLIGEVFEVPTQDLIEQYGTAPEEDPYSQATKGNIFRCLVHRRGDDLAKKWVHDMKKRLR